MALAAMAGLASAQTQTQTPAAAELKALLDDDLGALFRRAPMLATQRGVPGYDHLLPDVSPAQRERERVRERDLLARLQALDAATLGEADQVSYQLLLNRTRNNVDGQRFAGADALVLGTLGGIQTLMPQLAQTGRFRSGDDLHNYIRRIEAFPAFAEQITQRLQGGLRSGWLRPVPVLDRVIAAIDAHLVEQAEDSVLFGPFRRFADAVPEAERAALATAARRAIADDYQPALRRFKAFVATELRPRSPVQAGLAALPGGAAYYDFLIASNIVTGMDADQIHALGLAEVARLRGEIETLARRSGHRGSVDEFMTWLRSDPRFFFGSADELLAAYRALGAVVDPQLPRLFHAVPQMPYTVRGMSAAEAASSTAANYRVGSPRLGTAGIFTINALGFAAEPIWKKETLFLHETVPGHHLQGARAAELQGLHPWRQMASFNVAYSEGWALYAEKLGFELGLFVDPYQHYGHLQAELWRAARLVVDTGLHARNWPRERAVAYMETQAGLTSESAASEVDRYVSNPTQALGYLLGQRKLLELRERARSALGARFDVRDFHAVVLDQGAMPLAVLESRVDAWIVRSRGTAAP